MVLSVVWFKATTDSQIWSYFSLSSCEGGPPIAKILTCSVCPLHTRAVNTGRVWHYQKRISAPNMTKAWACVAFVVLRELTVINRLNATVCNVFQIGQIGFSRNTLQNLLRLRLVDLIFSYKSFWVMLILLTISEFHQFFLFFSFLSSFCLKH